nr:M20 family metallopeptidase [Corynebacterium lizhenjunii]
MDQWLRELDAVLPRAVALRHEIHSNPCLSGAEEPTVELFEQWSGLKLERVAQTGGLVRIGQPTGPAIALRADLDALPVQEQTGWSWESRNPSVMHACGHDVHLGALFAVVESARGIDLPVSMVGILQPREETYPSGALDITETGRLKELEVQHVIGAHVHPQLPLGSVACDAGFINAAAGEIEIHISGAGGHGAYPHHANDVAAVTAQIALGLNEVVRRNLNPMDPAVVSIGTISVGDGAANVLPEQGRILATVRGISLENNGLLADKIRQFASSVACGLDCVAEVDYAQGEPELVNDAELAAAFGILRKEFGLEAAASMRSLGADDFSFYSRDLPSIMCFVGVGDETASSLHDPRFLPGDEAVGCVARALICGFLAAAQRMGA